MSPFLLHPFHFQDTYSLFSSEFHICKSFAPLLSVSKTPSIPFTFHPLFIRVSLPVNRNLFSLKTIRGRNNEQIKKKTISHQNQLYTAPSFLRYASKN